MAIEITGVPNPAANLAINEVAPPTQHERNQRADPSSTTATRNDRVSLTPTAERLRHLEDSISSLPVVDTKRVEAIRQQVVNGTYRVDASRVADKLLNFETSLNGAARAQ
jgi:negative regulator of flagellin synthesis FlgM